MGWKTKFLAVAILFNSSFLYGETIYTVLVDVVKVDTNTITRERQLTPPNTDYVIMQLNIEDGDTATKARIAQMERDGEIDVITESLIKSDFERGKLTTRRATIRRKEMPEDVFKVKKSSL